MSCSIETAQGLIRLAAGWPSVATSGWDATTWATPAGAQQALHRAIDALTVAVTETQGTAARTALDLLTGACVVALDDDAHARHLVAQAARGRVDARRRQLLGGVASAVDVALLIGPGATIHGEVWTPDMCDARIEREVQYVLDECDLDSPVGEGWVDEETLRAWVAARRGVQRWR